MRMVARKQKREEVRLVKRRTAKRWGSTALSRRAVQLYAFTAGSGSTSGSGIQCLKAGKLRRLALYTCDIFLSLHAVASFPPICLCLLSKISEGLSEWIPDDDSSLPRQ